MPDEEREIAVINPNMPCGAHFAGRIRAAAEIDEITVVCRGIFGVFGLIIFAVEYLVFHVSFRGMFSRFLRKNSGKPKDKEGKAKNSENCRNFVFHVIYLPVCVRIPDRKDNFIVLFFTPVAFYQFDFRIFKVVFRFEKMIFAAFGANVNFCRQTVVGKTGSIS